MQHRITLPALWFALGLFGMSGVAIISRSAPLSDTTQGLLYGISIGLEMVGLAQLNTARRTAARQRSRIRVEERAG